MNQNLVYIDWTTVFTIVNTLILFFVLKHFLYDKVKAVLNSRKTEVENMYEEAQSASDEAKKLKSEYEQQMQTVKEQASEILLNANKKAQKQADDIIAQAKGQAEAAIMRADSQIEAQKKKAVNEIKDEIADIALMAAGEVIEKELDEESHKKLINDFIENAGDIKWQK